MLNVATLSFLTPWAFVGLLALPLVWWLLHLIPPRPHRVRFPAIQLLMRVTSGHRSSQSYPWWLLVLRLLIVALFVGGAATPVFNPQPTNRTSGPLVIIVDDGWAAAPDWQARTDYMVDLVGRAERHGRGVIVVPTALPVAPLVPSILTPTEARKLAQGLRPKPWQTDRHQILRTLSDPALGLSKASRVVWLSDGLDSGYNGNGDVDLANIFERLSRLGPVTVVTPETGREARALFPPYGEGEDLVIPIRRAHAGRAEAVSVVAYDDANRAVGRAIAAFEDGAIAVEARLGLPVETRNRIERVQLEGEHSAGAVVLLDERWQRRPVGLVSSEGIGEDQPLLSGQYYLGRALQDITEVRSGAIEDLLNRETAVMVLADPAPMNAPEVDDLTRWTTNGGVLVIFAGPRLATPGEGRLTDLLPVTLRPGDRAIGGAMSWRRPAAIAPFQAGSPFQGLPIPDDVRIRRQVLAEPTLDLEGRIWARLSDGTPLVTARGYGDGLVVLFHVTANAEWSNLPLSGLFVDMLQRVVQVSHGVGVGAGSGDSTADESRRMGFLKPRQTLNGRGVLGAPPASAVPLTPGDFELQAPSPRHPPGFYGTRDVQRALNLTANLKPLRALTGLPLNIRQEVYATSDESPLAHWFFTVAALLLALDMLLSLWLRGVTFFGASAHGRSGRAVLWVLVVVGVSFPGGIAQTQAQEQPGDPKRIDAANTTRIAYVLSGDAQTDVVSRLGLEGLGAKLAQRTAVELGPPDGIDPAVDELAFYPLLYWPITENTPLPGVQAANRINAFLANGGTILFDSIAAGGPGDVRQLRKFASVLDIPRLIPVSSDHVLTRSFYLLDAFPGRWAGSPVWVVPAEERVNDGVSPIVAGSHHWAAAWAMDANRQAMFAVVPEGERQREHAYRFGINLVMYVLTGNYKGDQVHLPIIMNRLGQ